MLDSGITKKERIIQKLSISPMFKYIFTTNRQSNHLQAIKKDLPEDNNIQQSGILCLT
jgi:hypothetical protein